MKKIEERIKKLEEALDIVDARVRLEWSNSYIWYLEWFIDHQQKMLQELGYDYKRAKQKNLWFETDNEVRNKYYEIRSKDPLLAFRELKLKEIQKKNNTGEKSKKTNGKTERPPDVND